MSNRTKHPTISRGVDMVIDSLTHLANSLSDIEYTTLAIHEVNDTLSTTICSKIGIEQFTIR